MSLFQDPQREPPRDAYIGLTSETVLYPAEIYPVQSTATGYIWEWRTEDGSRRSRHGFDLFYECLEDARAHGFEPRLKQDENLCKLVIDPLAFDPRSVDDPELVRTR